MYAHSLSHMEASLAGLVDSLRRYVAEHPVPEVLALLADHFPGQVVFSTSFGLEDQLLSHFIFTHDLPIRVFTLDTGRNCQETYSTWNKTLLRYDRPIDAYAPQRDGIEQLVKQKGPNSFYESVENRKECCHLRKIEPLQRALAGHKIWVTGIRAEQSANRQHMHAAEWDEGNQVLKVHPLFNWTWDECLAFAQQHGVPVNPLHQKGFVSIGCAPCTRAIKPGEDFRAGRWWWEEQAAKECGLHTTAPHQGFDPVVEAMPG